MPKTTFVATSPFTGEQFTRTSDHDYTFAVVYCDTVSRTAAELQNSIEYAERMNARALSGENVCWDGEQVASYVRQGEERIRECLEKIANQHRREAATFHRTQSLALKAMAKDGKFWSEAKVVPCTPKQK